MRARTVVVAAGLACAAGWLAKMVVMVSQGGPEEGSAAESIAFFLGLAGFAVVAAATGVLLRPGRGTGATVLAAVVGVLVAASALSLVQLALTALPGDDWWQPELAFVVAALAALVVAFASSRGRAAHRDANG